MSSRGDWAWRPFWVGYMVRMYIHHCLPPILFTPNGKLAHVHVDDTAEAIARCVEFGKLGEVYLLSNGNQTHREMIDDWKKSKGGCKKTWFWLPDPIAVFSLPEWRNQSSDYSGYRLFFVRNSYLPRKKTGNFHLPKQKGTYT